MSSLPRKGALPPCGPQLALEATDSAWLQTQPLWEGTLKSSTIPVAKSMSISQKLSRIVLSSSSFSIYCKALRMRQKRSVHTPVCSNEIPVTLEVEATQASVTR